MNALESLQGLESQAEDAKQAKTSGSSQELGKDDFLRLLVSQLENQDPLDPEDPTEFTAQLAQYSSLEQMTNINDNIKELGSKGDEISRMSALSLIDRKVTAETDTVEFDGKPVEIGCRFSDPVESGQLKIKDESGSVVDTIEISDPSEEGSYFSWDGTGGQGDPADPGKYYLEAVGTDTEGKEVGGTTLAGTLVTGADFSESADTLITSEGTLKISDIVKVNNSTPVDEPGV